jgi:predicted ATPase/DNA-binding winged helix-turn-helix (wHTH) protein
MTDNNSHQTRGTASFGPFQLTTSRRLLEKDGEDVGLSGRLMDILIALVQRSGQVLSPRELIRPTRPSLVVEDANVRVSVANLREALADGQNGARYIVNIPGRGYCFVASVRWTSETEIVRGPSQTLPCSPLKLPARLMRIIGRDDELATLSTLLHTHRCVSVIGPGGMGKTTVAVSVAHALLASFEGAVFFADLSTVSDTSQVANAVAAAVGCLVRTQDPVEGMVTVLPEKRALLVLDNCEHMIKAAAEFAECLITRMAFVRLLITSREALQIEGEYIYLLSPLHTPADCPDVTAARLADSPAVRLFMERATASGYSGGLTNVNASMVADICRRLDGIALAIELVASHVGTYGLEGVAELLDARFRILWRGRRTALPRHQTLQAIFDWSFNLLSARERRILCRLSVFIGVFTLDAAQALASDAGITASDVSDAIVSLTDRSLIYASCADGCVHFRLLDTTRTFVVAKRDEGGGTEATA